MKQARYWGSLTQARGACHSCQLVFIGCFLAGWFRLEQADGWFGLSGWGGIGVLPFVGKAYGLQRPVEIAVPAEKIAGTIVGDSVHESGTRNICFRFQSNDY